MRFTSAQAVEVTAQRIDFAVVSEITERMGQGPSRERIRRITLVDKRNRGFKFKIVQVLVEALDLACKQKALVHDATAAAAADVKTFASLFHQTADNIQLNIKRAVVFKSGTVKEHLTDMRQGFASRMANLSRIYRNFAELENLHAFSFGNFTNLSVKGFRFKRIFDKEHANAIACRKRRIKLAEELVRHRK